MLFGDLVAQSLHVQTNSTLRGKWDAQEHIVHTWVFASF